MKKTILLFLLLFVFLPLCSQRMFLLSVGISDYKGDKNDLHLPVKDAEVVAQVYEKNNDAQTVLLLNSNATCTVVARELRQLVSRAKKNDIIVMFFSGHGTPDGLVMYDGVLSHKRLRKILSESACVNKMVFADACYSGKMRVSNKKSSTGKEQNVMFFLSSRSNEKSIELRNMNNGLFTAFLERGLRGGADENRNRTVTAKELYKFVNNGVKKISREKQHPVMWGNFKDNMPVIKW